MASHDIPIGATQVSLAALNERSREIFRQIVESYLATGEPVGSRNLSRLLPITLSPASVRNVMSDLEQLGLIFAPHTSAGRLPTELGLRFFVDALMQVGDLSEQDRRSIEAQVAGAHTSKSLEAVLTEASQMLSGLTRSAGVVLTAKTNVRLKHVEFVRLEPERALAVLVAEDGQVENRVLNVPAGLPTSALTEAGNFLNARIRGRTLSDARADLESALAASRAVNLVDPNAERSHRYQFRRRLERSRRDASLRPHSQNRSPAHLRHQLFFFQRTFQSLHFKTCVLKLRDCHPANVFQQQYFQCSKPPP